MKKRKEKGSDKIFKEIIVKKKRKKERKEKIIL